MTHLRVHRSWKLVPLGELASVVMGQAPPGDSYNTAGNGISLIAGASDLGQVHPAPARWTNAPSRLCEAGDIIICVRATIGDLNWADRPYCLGRGVAGVRPSGKCEPEFLFYWLLANKEVLKSRGRGATFKTISKNHLTDLRTPCLHLTEQRRISAKINTCMQRVDEIGRLRAETVVEARAALPSLLNETFVNLAGSHDMRALGDVAIETRYGTSQKCREQPAGVAVLRIPNVIRGFVNHDDLKYCDLEKAELARLTLEDGDLLFVRTNGSRDLVGRCAIYKHNGTRCAFASYLIRVRLDQKQVLPHYTAFFLNSSRGRAEIDQRRRTSAGQYNINSENLRSIELPVPPLDVQREVVATLQDRQSVILQLQAELAAAQAEESQLRDAILRKAFAGEL